MKKVSVIIPFYNGVDWLKEAVKSAIDQTYKNIEIIVVNDGSKDDVDDFLAEFGNRIIYKYQENQGAAVARNYAMNIATGDYLAFLDSDDTWLPSKLEKQIRFMEEIGAIWSHTGFYNWWSSTGEKKIVDNYNDFGNIYCKSYVTLHIATPSVVVSRQTMIEHPEICFPPEYRKAEDTQYYRALAKYYPIALVKEPLAKIRMRNDNTFKQAVARFNLKANDFLKLRKDKSVPLGAKAIMSIYYVYAKLFGKASSPIKEKIALCCWSFPYVLERLYSKYIVWKNKPDKKFLKE